MYTLVHYWHYVSCHSLAYMDKYGEDERDILDNYLFESESVQNLLKDSAELDIIEAEDVIIAVGASSPYVRETQERFLVGCVSVISEWRDRQEGSYKDSYYDPIVRQILEIESIIDFDFSMKEERKKVVIIEDHYDLIGYYVVQTADPMFNDYNLEEWIDAFTHKVLPEDVLVENTVEYRVTGEEYFVPEHPLGYSNGICNGFLSMYIMTMPIDFQIEDFLRIRGAELI